MVKGGALCVFEDCLDLGKRKTLLLREKIQVADHDPERLMVVSVSHHPKNNHVPMGSF
jgi:hypothetical protein